MNVEQKVPQTVSEIYESLKKHAGRFGDSLSMDLTQLELSEHESMVASETGRLFIWDKGEDPGGDMAILDKPEGRHIDDESDARDLLPYDLPNTVAYKLNDDLLDRIEIASKALRDVGASSLYIESGINVIADRFVNDDSREDNDDESVLGLDDYDSHIKVTGQGFNFGVWLNSEGDGGEKIVTLSSQSLIFEKDFAALRREAVLAGGYLRAFAWAPDRLANDALNNMLSEQPSTEADLQLDREVAAGLLTRMTLSPGNDHTPLLKVIEKARPGAIEVLLIERFDFHIPDNVNAMLDAVTIKSEGHRSSGRKLKL